MTNQQKLGILGTWEFYLAGSSPTKFDGTYKDYLDYCDRTNEYANGRYCNNYSGFRPTIYHNNKEISYTAEAWVAIENEFANDEVVEPVDLNCLGF